MKSKTYFPLSSTGKSPWVIRNIYLPRFSLAEEGNVLRFYASGLRPPSPLLILENKNRQEVIQILHHPYYHDISILSLAAVDLMRYRHDYIYQEIIDNDEPLDLAARLQQTFITKVEALSISVKGRFEWIEEEYFDERDKRYPVDIDLDLDTAVLFTFDDGNSLFYTHNLGHELSLLVFGKEEDIQNQYRFESIWFGAHFDPLKKGGHVLWERTNIYQYNS